MGGVGREGERRDASRAHGTSADSQARRERAERTGGQPASRAEPAEPASTTRADRGGGPTDGILGYLYALAEAEALLACQAVGVDSGVGLIHSDIKGRQSLALDLIEPVRPQVDAFALDLLERRTFRKVEFTETTDGHCRLKAPLTHELAETVPRWAQAVAPIAERVAHTLGQAMAGKYVAVTPLTGTKHRNAQAIVKARKSATSSAAKSTSARQRASGSPIAAWNCPDCGGQVTNRRHVRCDQCIAADRRQTPTLRATRAAAISRRRQAEAVWREASSGVSSDPEEFAQTVIPALQSVKLSVVMSACGVSKSTASSWRSGKTRPHPSHWAALATLVGAASS
jgi:hypothetical protein